jgi:hypothetical protein
MSAVLRIRSFKGIAEPAEDPEKYLDDVPMAAEAWEDDKGDAAALEEPNYEASWWWGGLAKEEKTVWTTVKSLFPKKFADPVSTGNDGNYEETYGILGLSQKAGQSIEEYIREAEHLHRKVRPVLKQTLGAAVIKGLADEQRRANVSFALDGTTYDFNGAIDKIQASYRSIGEADPFKKHSQKPWPSTNPFYSAPGGRGPPPIPVMAPSDIGVPGLTTTHPTRRRTTTWAPRRRLTVRIFYLVRCRSSSSTNTWRTMSRGRRPRIFACRHRPLL